MGGCVEIDGSHCFCIFHGVSSAPQQIPDAICCRYFMDLPKEHDMVRCVREGLEGPSKAKANITYEECSGKHLGLECKWFCHVLSCFLGLEENSQCRNQMFTCSGDAIDHTRGT